MELHDTMCCGGGELEGFNDTTFSPKELLAEYARACCWYADDEDFEGKEARAWIAFSYAADVNAKGRGSRTRTQGGVRLRAWEHFITNNGLGTIVIMPHWRKNPNHGNKSELRAGLWLPNNKAAFNYLKKHDLLEECDCWRYNY